LREARLATPNISISVEVATSDVLGEHLAIGELDFMLGRLPSHLKADLFDEVPIAVEPVSFIARKDHALTWLKNVSAEKLLEYDWVLPLEETILRRSIVSTLRERGLSAPVQTFNTSSFLPTLALLCQSNAIAPISKSVANVFAPEGEEIYLLKAIDTELKINIETFSLFKPADRVFTPATERIYQLVLKAVGSKPE